MAVYEVSPEKMYANCGDDENSQAEGTSEGAVGYSRSHNVEPNNASNNANNNTNNTSNNASQQHNSTNPHYENIYESIDQYAAAAAAAAPADNNNQPGPSAAPQIVAAASTPRPANTAAQSNQLQSRSQPAYRNELYDRTAGYDVPRQMFRNNYPQAGGASGGSSSCTTASKRRANLHLDLNPNRPRYTTASRPHRQRSFDDTESNYYNNFRYENIYEQIHEEPIYRNFSSSAGSASGGAGGPHNRVYGRLGVIGHGIGRIERHLSSSCGNIDHYNLGGHYAVLGHSHLGTVGHIRLNAGTVPTGTTTKDTNGVKSLNFFSCLGRENSQSMNNIHRATTNPSTANASAAPSSASSSTAPPITASSVLRPNTGAIPKTPKSKVSAAQKASDAPTNDSPTTIHDSSLNRISKSSLQWLLVNKWLPMWIGQEPDYNILDFNFMFSRNCGGCGDTFNRQQSVVRFNGHAEMRPRNDHGIARRAFGGNGPSSGGSGTNGVAAGLRPMRINHSLTRLRECEYGALMRRDGSLDERSRPRGDSPYDRDRYRDEYYERRNQAAREIDPFRHWELNTENNSFRPAGGVTRDIRRITDGTYPPPASSTATLPTTGSHGLGNMTRQSLTTTATESASCGSAGGGSLTMAKTMERLTNPHRVMMDSRTESGNDTPSPDLGGRRYSDNTEDDQHNDNDVSDIDDD